MPSNKYIQVGEHHILIPEPKSKEDIFFINEKKENAFWQRDKIIKQYKSIWFDFLPYSNKPNAVYTKMYQPATIYNEDGLLISLNEKDSIYVDEIYKQETQRRLHGVHFKNGEDIIWITGDHYFFLMYARMQRHDGKGLYADYRKFQRDYCYLVHHARISENILGAFVSKPKKTGITNLHWSGVTLNRGTLIRNKNFGYMNINLAQAAKTFNDYFLHAYNGLISPLRPEWKQKSEKEGSITFAASYRNSKTRTNLDDIDLNTTVFCVPTKSKAFDVAVMEECCFDEPTKYEESFAEIWRTNKEAIKIQSKINGKAWLFNYTPEDDGKSFLEARDVFLDSELKTITKDSEGQTKSGLICYHIPAYAAWEGAFDKYGNCDEEKANKGIQRERDKVKGKRKELQAIIRQYANDKKEAWGMGGATSIFDPIRIANLQLNLDELLRTGEVYKQGYLEWVNPIWEVGKKDKRPKGQFDRVRFMPLTKEQIDRGEVGKIRMYEHLPVELQNIPLRQGRDEYWNINAPAKFFVCGGIDPVNYVESGDVEEGSIMSMHNFIIHDENLNTINRRIASKVIVADHFFRADNPEENYQDIVKWIIFFGSLVIIEANVSDVYTKLEKEGLGNYLLWRDEGGNITFFNAAKRDSLKPIRTLRNKQAGIDTVRDLIILITNYLLEGDKNYNEADYGATIKDILLFLQLSMFDPENTKRFDKVMSFGYGLLAHESLMALLAIPESNGYNQQQIQYVLTALSKVF